MATAAPTAHASGQTEQVDPDRKMIEAVRGVFGGCHPGYRAAHSRGTVVRGTFTPTGVARDLTTAQFMRQGPIDVTARFSNASGDPSQPDNKRDSRGFAVKFHPPGGDETAIVAVTLPQFFVKTAEEFLILNHALKRGRRIPFQVRKLVHFALTHRGFLRRFAAAFKRPVPSYANCRYNALHTFIWKDGNDIRRYVRYSWRPADGEATLSRKAAKKLPRDYLYQDLYERLGREPSRPIRFTLEIQLATKEDVAAGRIDDPTVRWPKVGERFVPATPDHVDDPTKNRKREQFLPAGVLELTELGDPVEQLMFDPVPGVDGLAASNDSILLARPGAYVVSAEQRTQPNCGRPK